MGRDQSRTSDILEAVTLLVVDMQETFLNAVPDGDAVVRRCAFAIEAARTLGIRVVFTEQVPEKLGHMAPALRELAPDARVFAKNSFSALGANGLAEHLRKTGVYHLLIAGIETPVCVYQTALHAQDSDFDVTVLSDCVSGRRGDDARIVLQALAGASCHVLPAETVFYSMLGNSAHRLFHEYTELVKAYAGDIPSIAPMPREARTRKPPAAPQSQSPDFAPREPAEALEPSEVLPAELPESADLGFPPAFDADDSEDQSADVASTDESRKDDSGETRKRPRRRRGGARRRKARERTAAEEADTSSEAGATGESGPEEASEPEREPPADPAAEI